MRGNSRGFTLVEVMVGMAVFMIGMLGITALQISSNKAGAFSANLSEAAALAVAKIEELNRLAYNNANLNDSDNDGTSINSPNYGLNDEDGNADHSDVNQGRNGAFTVFWNVTAATANVPVADSKTINVIVRWRDRNELRRINVKTIRAQ